MTEFKNIADYEIKNLEESFIIIGFFNQITSEISHESVYNK